MTCRVRVTTVCVLAAAALVCFWAASCSRGATIRLRLQLTGAWHCYTVVVDGPTEVVTRRYFGPLRLERITPRSGPRASLAFVRDGGICTAEPDGTGQRLVVRRGTSPCWSPDRSRLAFLRGGEAWVAGPAGQTPRLVSHTGGRAVRVAWRSARALLVVRETVYAIRYRREGERAETVVHPRLRDILLVPLAGGPATLWLGTGRTAGQMGARDYAGGQYVGNFDCPAVSPDGTRVAFAKDGDLWVAVAADLDRREGGFLERVAAVARWDLPVAAGDESSAGIAGLAWMPDGKGLVYSLERYAGSGVAEIWTMRADGSGRRMLAHTGQAAGGACLNPQAGPDGREVYFQSGGATGWEVWAVSLRTGAMRRVLSNAKF